MYPGADRLPFGLIIAPPCPTTPAPVQCAMGNLLGLNNLPASRSKGTLFGQLNVRHTFNMTRGPTTVVLNRHRQKALQSKTLQVSIRSQLHLTLSYTMTS